MRATLDIAEAQDRRWDAVVVGAGPAGALGAALLARAGASTLLIDRSAFPRPKVCGCCVGVDALATLERCGLAERVRELGGETLRRFDLHAHGARATLALRGGVSLSRSAFDGALVAEAVRCGCAFLSEATARLGAPAGARRIVVLDTPGGEARVSTKLVLAADGVAGRLLDDEPGMRPHVKTGSKIGIQAVLSRGSCVLEPGEVRMACARDGYVGFARLEDGRVNVAGAVRASALRELHSPPLLAQRIVEACGLTLPEEAHQCVWKGTTSLTRRRRVAGYRLFALGDTAGYVEPFTGEGIGWALRAGQALAPIALEALGRWNESYAEAWVREHERVIVRRQRSCRLAAWTLDHPRLARTAVRVVGRWPRLASAAPNLGARGEADAAGAGVEGAA